MTYKGKPLLFSGLGGKKGIKIDSESQHTEQNMVKKKHVLVYVCEN